MSEKTPRNAFVDVELETEFELDGEETTREPARATAEVALGGFDVDGERNDFLDVCTPEQARKLLEENRIRPARVAYRRRAGPLKASHSGCTGEERVFPSFLYALWDSEGSQPRFEDPIRMQELQIWDGDNRKLLRFHGDMAVDRLLALAPSVCSNVDRRAIASYRVDSHFVIRLSLVSWSRSAAGRSYRKSIPFWKGKCRSNEKVAHLLGPDVRTRRFWKGVGDMHLFLTVLCRAYEDFQGLRRSALEWSLNTGRFENSFLNHVRDGINLLMNSAEKHEVTDFLRTKSVEIQAQYYKLRKVIPKDDNYPLENCLKAQARFCSTTAHTVSNVGKIGIELFQLRFRKFLQSQEPSTLRKWSRPDILHQGAAGLWFTRSNGGRPEELQMIVGLHRLSRGARSGMTENFGTLDSNDDLDALLSLWSSIDAFYDEIVEACNWFLEDFVYAREIPRLFFSIFPEREVKSRTFMLYDYASQLGGNMAKCALVAFLKQTPFCEEAYRGIRSKSRAHDLVNEAVRLGQTVLSADASTSTDNLDFERCIEVYAPSLDGMHPFASRTVRRVFSPTMTGCIDIRPKLSPVAGFPSRSSLLRGLGARVSRTSVEAVAWRPRGESPATYCEDHVPEIRLRPHSSRIVESLKTHRRVMLKSPTGSGKTVFAASVTTSIIQFTSILNLEAFSDTLRFYGVAHSKHYSTSKEEEGLKGDRTILTTGFYVMQLARKFPHMLVVLDEAESLRQEFLLNIVDTKGLRNDVLLMSATPDQIRRHDAFLVEIDAQSPWRTEDVEMDEAEMIAEVAGGSRKTLICVHSEPFARKLALSLEGSFVLDSESRFSGYMETVARVRVIISTNVVRASLTIPDLDDVVDYGIQYEDVDFPSQGVSNLVITDVDEFQRTQLRGRVGRMRDGRYIRVRHSIESVGSLPFPSLRLTSVSNRLRELDWDEMPREVSAAPVVVEAFSLRFLERVFLLRFTNNTPHSLQLVRSQLNKGGFFLTQLLLFEESGVPTRITSLRMSPNEADRELAKSFRVATKGDYVRHIEEIIAGCKEKVAFRQQMTLISKWTSSQTKEETIAHGLGSESAEVILAFRLWRNVVKAEGGTYSAAFRSFRCAKSNEDPEYAVLIGATRFGGTSKYLVAVPISESTFSLLKSQIEMETVVDLRSSSTEEIDLKCLSIGRESSDEIGRQKKSVYVTVEEHDLGRVFSPEDLESCLSVLEKEAKACRSKRTTSRGCPQSHVLSFPTLNALNYAAYLGARHFHSDLHALGYGDDALARGTREGCEAFLQARESYGLLTNRGSTGFSEAGRPGLAVFCEMIFDLETGKEIISAKPKATNQVYRAYHKDDTWSSSEAHQSDVRGLLDGMRLKIPSVYESVMIECDPEADLLPFRSTIPRQILHRMSLRESTALSIVTTRKAAEIIEYLEPLVLLVSPSSKGAPIRQAPRPTRRQTISLEFYEKVEAFLKRYSNYGESEMRLLPQFLRDGTLFSVAQEDEGRILDFEELERTLKSSQ